MNTKQFNSKLSGVLLSAKNMSANIQLLVTYAISKVKDDGNLSDVSTLLLKTKNCKAINSRQLEKFVLGHISNIEWNTKKSKKGEKVTQLRQVKGETLEVFQALVNWDEFEVKASEPKASKLCKVSDDARKLKADAYRAKVALTTDVAVLTSNLDLLKQQVQMLENQIKANTVIVSVAS